MGRKCRIYPKSHAASGVTGLMRRLGHATGGGERPLSAYSRRVSDCGAHPVTLRRILEIMIGAVFLFCLIAGSGHQASVVHRYRQRVGHLPQNGLVRGRQTQTRLEGEVQGA